MLVCVFAFWFAWACGGSVNKLHMVRARPTLRQWLGEKPFGLGLSSGFFGFFAHAGVLTVLEDEALLPVRLSGSSAGALASGLWASGLSAVDMRDELFRLRRDDFWDPRPGLGLLAGRLFRQRLERVLPVRTFAECRAPLAISVYDVLTRRTRVIDAGLLAPAIHASCAVPLLFHPTWHEGRPLLDGGIADHPGLDGIPHGERLFYHHLVSRSPWRRLSRSSLAIPDRPDMAVLAIADLPRAGPFRLAAGARAFDVARKAAQEALDRPVELSRRIP
jgi:NTE family protein